MAQFPVKWFSSYMGDSPALGDSTHGDFIALLKACLIYGFNPKTPGSVSYEPSAGAITVVLTADHGFLQHQVVKISNAVESEYNGEYRVIAVGNDWIQLAVAAAPSAPVATGSGLEIRVAPVGGWQIVAEDATNHHIALKRTAIDATDHVFMITNADTAYAGNFTIVRICESFTDFQTYEQTTSQWWASSHRYATKEWMLVADKHMLYWVNRYASNNRRSVFVLGDIKTVRPGDVSHCLMNGCERSSATDWNDTSGERFYTDFANLGGSDYRTMARAYHQLPGSTSWTLMGIGGTIGAGITYPNPQTNGFYVSTGELMVIENSGIRGFMPGIVQPLQSNGQYHNVILDNIPGLEGVPVMLWYATNNRNYNSGQYLVGWRLDRWRPEVEG